MQDSAISPFINAFKPHAEQHPHLGTILNTASTNLLLNRRGDALDPSARQGQTSLATSAASVKPGQPSSLKVGRHIDHGDGTSTVELALRHPDGDVLLRHKGDKAMHDTLVDSINKTGKY